MARLEGHCGKDCDRDRVIAEYNITGLIFSFRKETLEYKYKYVLDIDGNTFSGRFLNLLKPGSRRCSKADWIRPYEHYIPVKPDLSDLVEKVEWAISYEGKARRIQETGKLFTHCVMTDE
ncbi:hypothetical protein B0H14DRAFT_2557250 [Mycena olivaceomarginata]|nr:hypothetical protein B0H14DRAFT_2557250 [Mycena olivaceomarginata]